MGHLAQRQSSNPQATVEVDVMFEERLGDGAMYLAAIRGVITMSITTAEHYRLASNRRNRPATPFYPCRAGCLRENWITFRFQLRFPAAVYAE